ncbi:MAG: hypothetical protein IPQ07_12905 [Myxococcales bacterium]|nr:hypothetical protein [Myxococcales bacterium]
MTLGTLREGFSRGVNYHLHMRLAVTSFAPLAAVLLAACPGTKGGIKH